MMAWIMRLKALNRRLHLVVAAYRHPLIDSEQTVKSESVASLEKWMVDLNSGDISDAVYYWSDWCFLPIGSLAGIALKGPYIRIGLITLKVR